MKGIAGLNPQTPADFARMQYDFSLLAGDIENYAKDDSIADNQAAILKIVTQLTANEIFTKFAATINGENPQAIGKLATDMAMFINGFQMELMGGATIGRTTDFDDGT